MVYKCLGFISPKHYEIIEHVGECVHNLLWEMKL